jgi:hypothetical protein
VLLDDEAAWGTASSACRAHFEAHHTMDAAVRRYLEVFAQVLGRRDGTAPAGREALP